MGTVDGPEDITTVSTAATTANSTFDAPKSTEGVPDSTQGSVSESYLNKLKIDHESNERYRQSSH